MTPTARHIHPPQAADTGIDAALALARETAEQVARRKAEQALSWAEHTRQAMDLVKEAGDE